MGGIPTNPKEVLEAEASPHEGRISTRGDTVATILILEAPHLPDLYIKLLKTLARPERFELPTPKFVV